MGTYDLFRKIAQSNLNASERETELIKYDILLDFEDSPSFESVYFNESVTTTGVWITNNSSNPNKKNDLIRKIIMKPDDTLERGDLITWLSEKWIVLSSQMYGSIYYYGTIQKCNNVIRWYDENGVLITEPCVYNNNITSTGFDYNRDIILQDGEIEISVQYNLNTKKIKTGNRFILNSQSYVVTNLDNHALSDISDFDSVGLIKLIMTKDEDSSDDDLINNIPNTTQYSYSVQIDQSDFQGSAGDSGNITASVFLNEQLVSEPITFTSSDITKATINSSTGLYSLIADGSVVFTAKMSDNNLISDYVNVTIATPIVDSYNIVVNPKVNEIYLEESQIYSAFLFKNNVQQADVKSGNEIGSIKTFGSG